MFTEPSTPDELDQLEAQLDAWLRVHLDENPAIATRYGVMSIPTLNLYKGGEVVQTVVGAKPKAALERELAAHLA